VKTKSSLPDMLSRDHVSKYLRRFGEIEKSKISTINSVKGINHSTKARTCTFTSVNKVEGMEEDKGQVAKTSLLGASISVR